MPFQDHAGLADALLPAVLRAGQAILQHRAAGLAVEYKADQSPVTGADRAAESILLAALAAVAPGVPVIAEEQMAAGVVTATADTFFLVDALDGTREYVSGGDDFTINVGLIEDGKPVFGLVYAPAMSWLFATLAAGRVVEAKLDAASGVRSFADFSAQPVIARVAGRNGLVAVVSKSHLDAATKKFLSHLTITEQRPAGSSLKFCLVARGEADVYPRFGPTCEWDTAAGHAVLSAAGGSVVCSDGAELAYGKASDRYFNPHFVAWGTRKL